MFLGLGNANLGSGGVPLFGGGRQSPMSSFQGLGLGNSALFSRPQTPQNLPLESAQFSSPGANSFNLGQGTFGSNQLQNSIASMGPLRPGTTDGHFSPIGLFARNPQPAFQSFENKGIPFPEINQAWRNHPNMPTTYTPPPQRPQDQNLGLAKDSDLGSIAPWGEFMKNLNSVEHALVNIFGSGTRGGPQGLFGTLGAQFNSRLRSARGY